MTAGQGSRPVLRQDGVALWRQIATTLHQRISDGTYAPGQQLPTEDQLARGFGVNRHTVRRALEALSRDGLIRVEQGRGSFVAEDVIEYAVEARTRFSEWIRRHNKEPSGNVLRLEETAAPASVAAGLGIRTGAKVVLLERVGLADGQPVCVACHWFPSAKLPGMLSALRSEATITEALRACGVSDYLRQVTRVSARLPTPQEATLLRTTRVRPLLATENVNVDRQGAIVEYATALYPTPRVQIVFEP
ncbi:MAG: phosphonate metabolism transcriptional regulator PhnF [Proteobacteria bacterium]|nr:phosphonate metabolism transcriptional regulator PhnF [Pseudomonadota bacterium]